MSDDLPYGYDPARDGCRVCGSNETETVDGVNGRRCAAHPPQWDRKQATKLADAGLVDLAVAYRRTFRGAA